MLSRKSLAQDGWVIHEPHRGFRVAPLLRGDLLDTYRLWSIVEGEISARAAERITPQEAALVVEADTRPRDLDDHSGSNALDLNDVLHSPLHRASRATKLLRFVGSVWRSRACPRTSSPAVICSWPISTGPDSGPRRSEGRPPNGVFERPYVDSHDRDRAPRGVRVGIRAARVEISESCTLHREFIASA